MSREQIMTVLASLGVATMLGASVWGLRNPPAKPETPPEVATPVLPAPPVPPKRESEPVAEPPPTTLFPPATELSPLPPPTPVIERVGVDGQDLADLMNVLIWKYRFTLDPGRYTAYIWSERWERDNPVPEVRLLASNSADWTEGDLVMKLPTESDARLFIRLGEGNVTRAAEAEAIAPPSPLSWAMLDRQALLPDVPIHLVTMTHNLSELPRSMLTGAHGVHDVTVYIKAGFTKSDSAPFDAGKWVLTE